MAALYLANLIVLAVAGWAIWERRDSLHSPADAPMTIGIALFALGAALDSPWPGVAEASFPWTGRFYLLMGVGHICYLLGAAVGMKATFMRLMPDDAIGPFLKRRVVPVVAVAAPVMLVCLAASPMTSTMSADHLYFVTPDGWLRAYWVTFVGALVTLEVVSMYGGWQLFRDPRSISAKALVASQAVGVLACLLIGVRLIVGGDDESPVLIWVSAYVAITGGALAAAYSWRQRMKTLRGATPA